MQHASGKLHRYDNDSKTINGCYDNLRIAIVQLTVKDYRRAVRNLETLLCMFQPNDKLLAGAESRVEYFERWFLSEYGSLLCADMGEAIIEFVRNEVYANE